MKKFLQNKFNLILLKNRYFSFSNVNKGQNTSTDSSTPGHHSGNFDKKGHHLKSDLTHDMRFKENNADAGRAGGMARGAEISDNKSTNQQGQTQSSHNKGEFSGKFDKQGHHLRSDGKHDLRFKENSQEDEATNSTGRKQS